MFPFVLKTCFISKGVATDVTTQGVAAAIPSIVNMFFEIQLFA